MAEVLVRAFRPHEYPAVGLEQPDDRSGIHTARRRPSRKVARYSLPGKGTPRGINRTWEDPPGSRSGEAKRPASDPRAIECGPGGTGRDTRRSESGVNRFNARRVDYARSRAPVEGKVVGREGGNWLRPPRSTRSGRVKPAGRRASGEGGVYCDACTRCASSR
jgi:hypothetical protein